MRAVFVQDFIEGFAFDVVHDNIDGDAIVNDVDNSRQRWMVQPLHHVRFGQQTVYDNLVIFAVALLADLLDSPLFV